MKVYFLSIFGVFSCVVITWWSGPGGIEAYLSG